MPALFPRVPEAGGDPTTVSSCEIIAQIAGLTDESVCPTFASMGLRFRGAGAFACQPIVSQLLNLAADVLRRLPPAGSK
jgi:hypothetical protein